MAGLATAVRNDRLNVIRDAIDGGGAAGSLLFYTAPRPATGGTPTGATLLGTTVFSYPCASDAAAGVLTFSAITSDNMADNTGTAAWARALASDSDFVADFSVTIDGGGGEILLDTVLIVADGVIAVSSGALTEGNA